MYDIEFVVSVCGKDKYAERIPYFKKCGLFNIGSHKVKLKILTGTDKIEEIDTGWPENIDIQVVPGFFDVVTPKVCEYYFNLQPEEIQKSKWHVRVDDDSVTDVGHLLDCLNKSYYWQDKIYCGADHVNALHHCDIETMRRMELIDGEFENGRVALPVYHEWEMAVLSQSALLEILSNDDAVRFLKLRSEHKDGWCESPLSIASKIAKVPYVCCPYLTQHPMVSSLSVFGGILAHIHYIAPDIDRKISNLVSRVIHKESLDLDFVGKSYVLGNGNPHNVISVITVKGNGTIEPANDHVCSFWTYEDESLCIYERQGGFSMKLEPNENFTSFVGNNRSGEKRAMRQMVL